jgi:ABC-type Fe3+ transport system permease subunit
MLHLPRGLGPEGITTAVVVEVVAVVVGTTVATTTTKSRMPGDRGGDPVTRLLAAFTKEN